MHLKKKNEKKIQKRTIAQKRKHQFRRNHALCEHILLQ
jgi:hypothetical protein